MTDLLSSHQCTVYIFITSFRNSMLAEMDKPDIWSMRSKHAFFNLSVKLVQTVGVSFEHILQLIESSECHMGLFDCLRSLLFAHFFYLPTSYS